MKILPSKCFQNVMFKIIEPVKTIHCACIYTNVDIFGYISDFLNIFLEQPIPLVFTLFIRLMLMFNFYIV
jgi:hypothetical protein